MSGRARWPPLLLALGLWAAVTPYLATAIGLRVEVAADVEVVDHVVPGLLAALSAVAALAAARARSDPSGGLELAGAGIGFLAGVWITSTHVPLLAQAGRGEAGWDAALLHSSSGLPLLVLGLWLLASIYRRSGREDRERGTGPGR